METEEMGGFIGKSSRKEKKGFSAQDKAVYDLKVQRDRLAKYVERV